MLGQSSYGKSHVRLVQVLRRAGRDELRDLTIAIRFAGAYDASFTEGDNSAVLPTDTMKNTVYALAAREQVREPETFGVALATHFLAGNPRLRRVRIDLVEHPWSRMARGEREHAHAFIRSGSGARTAAVQASRDRTVIRGGVTDMVVMKSAHSAFSGFPRDEYTTLPETRDRLLATSLRATWRYGAAAVEFGTLWRAVRTTLLDTFADHRSESVQHTLYAMGQAVVDGIAEVEAIRLVMPNRHHLPVDLSRFGLENRNEIFVATEEPYGMIQATIVR